MPVYPYRGNVPIPAFQQGMPINQIPKIHYEPKKQPNQYLPK
jgi:hypothetical protein